MFGKLLTLKKVLVGTITPMCIVLTKNIKFSNFLYADSVDVNVTKSEKWDSNWDKLENQGVDPKSIPVHNIYLIRHGQYLIQEKNSKDKKLTQLGREQSAVTGRYLKSILSSIDFFIHSTVVRAKETADIIFHEVDDVKLTESTDLLAEGMPIVPHRYSNDSSKHELSEHVDQPRIEAAFRKYIKRGYPSDKKSINTVIVCHANVIRYFLLRALQLEPRSWLDMSLYHASVTKISINGKGSVSLRFYGNAGHMDPKLLST
ncbi:hypothetical protein A3Q56_00319 [Intoshia linei]|uniref:Serine/threonine-protein phosphatase PGAM5, mitochondrial n=1 Tax=Intoshia linei TaxID=1819745 RepID=A0A177BCH4_9BILA|nr:hypothetical protein A3Q56_00319 [Intoshia linei]